MAGHQKKSHVRTRVKKIKRTKKSHRPGGQRTENKKIDSIFGKGQNMAVT